MTRRQEAIVMKFVLNYCAELLRTSLDTGPSFGFPDSPAGIAAAIAVYETVETLADSLALRAGREVSHEELLSCFETGPKNVEVG